MKSKLIIVLLIGMLMGSLLGGIITPAIRATEYNYQLENINTSLQDVYNQLYETHRYIKKIYYEMD